MRQLQVTYDSTLSEMMWKLIGKNVKDKTCPYCGRKLTAKTFAGWFHYQGNPRPIHKAFPCLLDYADDVRKSVTVLANIKPYRKLAHLAPPAQSKKGTK